MHEVEFREVKYESLPESVCEELMKQMIYDKKPVEYDMLMAFMGRLNSIVAKGDATLLNKKFIDLEIAVSNYWSCVIPNHPTSNTKYAFQMGVLFACTRPARDLLEKARWELEIADNHDRFIQNIKVFEIMNKDSRVTADDIYEKLKTHYGELLNFIVDLKQLRLLDARYWSGKYHYGLNEKGFELYRSLCKELGMEDPYVDPEEPTMEQFMYGQDMGSPEDGSL